MSTIVCPYKVLYYLMHFIPFDVYRTEWTSRAEVLAGTTADTLVLVYRRHFHLAVRAFKIHHLDGSRRAVAGAVAAADFIG